MRVVIVGDPAPLYRARRRGLKGVDTKAADQVIERMDKDPRLLRRYRDRPIQQAAVILRAIDGMRAYTPVLARCGVNHGRRRRPNRRPTRAQARAPDDPPESADPLALARLTAGVSACSCSTRRLGVPLNRDVAGVTPQKGLLA
jgi:hypothetical protein